MTGVAARDDGGVDLLLDADERDLLKSLAAQLIEIVAGRAAGDDPALARLFPSAYADDEAAAAEFRRLAEDDIALGKETDARAVVASLERAGADRIRLDEAAALAWLRTLTALRLTLATRLGIDEDGDEGDESDPELPLTRIYLWCGMLQEAVIAALEA